MSVKFFVENDLSVFDSMPEVSDNLWNKAKDHFKKYLFIYPKKNNSRECVCSVCGKLTRVDSVDVFLNYGMFDILNASHNDKVCCPFCGVECVAKSAGIRRHSLSEHHYFAFLIPVDFNNVWIRTFTVSRCYEGYDCYANTYEYFDFPEYRISEVDRYHMSPGNSLEWRSFHWNGREFGKITDGFLEAFTDKNGAFNCYPCYKILSESSFEKTFLKYSGLDKYRAMYRWEYRPIQFYAYYAKYPLIEMLCKSSLDGGKHLVHDLLNGEFNKRVINWNATSFREVFNMSPEEYRLWQENGGHLGEFKCVRRFGKYTKINVEANDLMRELFSRRSYREQQKIISRCKKYKIPFVRFLKYLKRVIDDNPGCSRCPAPDVYITWSDYIDNAEELRYDLKDPVVFMPKNLFEAHDIAFKNADINCVQNLEQKSAQLYRELTKKYSFEDDQFIIVVPHKVQDIVNEGKCMHHCVGGYAERHFNGSTVILFLREKDKMAKSFITIEMNGNVVRQARMAYNAAPTAEAKEFIDKWVAHLNEPKKRKMNKKENEVIVA